MHLFEMKFTGASLVPHGQCFKRSPGDAPPWLSPWCQEENAKKESADGERDSLRFWRGY